MGINIGDLEAVSIDIVHSIINSSIELEEESVEKPIEEIEGFIQRNADALREASLEFALELIANATSGEYDFQHFKTSLDSLSADELVSLAEVDAADALQRTEAILGRRKKLAEDVRNTLGTVARSALAAGVAALTGLAK